MLTPSRQLYLDACQRLAISDLNATAAPALNDRLVFAGRLDDLLALSL
ncbi:MAG TPA: hypothetical protein VIT41_08510 [Microlunatus sp.]